MENTTPARPVIQEIPVDRIVPSPFQVRKIFNEESLKELAESLKERQTTPIQVRPTGDKFELIAGERRWRAAQLIGKPTLRAVVEQADDQEAALCGLIENLQRVDLNPIERGQGYKMLSDPPFNLSQEKIALQAGLTDHATVGRHIALLELPLEIQDFVSRDTISEVHCRYLKRIGSHEQQIALATQAAKEGWSVKKTEKEVNHLIGATKNPDKSSSSPDIFTPDEENPKDPAADVWEEIKQNTAGWSWMIRYVGPLKWQFNINLSLADSKNLRKTLGQWFLAMAAALGETRFEQHWEEPAPTSAPPPNPIPEVPKPALDPRVAAMVARQLAKGRIL